MIIAIAGVSQAGKSTLANILRQQLGHEHTTIICQDDFVKDVELIPQIRGHLDWEHPDSIDHAKFREAILAEAARNKYVIAEGLMVLWDAATRALFDKCIFIEIDKNTFVRRKLRDDRWGIEPDWYVEHIWQSYLWYGLYPECSTCLVIDGRKKQDATFIIRYLIGRPNE
ncbi:MAG: hypothetical protein IPM52_04310 [Bacteroidetes bacterium]|nr:hypothetical protein [Bacteroidota bacterium]